MATIKSFIAEVSITSPFSEQRPRVNARNINFETYYGGQFRLSTQLIIINYLESEDAYYTFIVYQFGLKELTQVLRLQPVSNLVDTVFKQIFFLM